jgi:hypothetical protein
MPKVTMEFRQAAFRNNNDLYDLGEYIQKLVAPVINAGSSNIAPEKIQWKVWPFHDADITPHEVIFTLDVSWGDERIRKIGKTCGESVPLRELKNELLKHPLLKRYKDEHVQLKLRFRSTEDIEI